MTVRENVSRILKEVEHVGDQLADGDCSAFVDALTASKRVFCYGLGRAGMAMKAFTMRLMHMGKEVYFLTETITPNFGAGDLFVVSSGSGETAQLIALAMKARKLGGKVAVRGHAQVHVGHGQQAHGNGPRGDEAGVGGPPTGPWKRSPVKASALAAAPPGSICERVAVVAYSRSLSQRRRTTSSSCIIPRTESPPPKPTAPSQSDSRTSWSSEGPSLRPAAGRAAVGRSPFPAAGAPRLRPPAERL